MRSTVRTLLAAAVGAAIVASASAVLTLDRRPTPALAADAPAAAAPAIPAQQGGEPPAAPDSLRIQEQLQPQAQAVPAPSGSGDSRPPAAGPRPARLQRPEPRQPEAEQLEPQRPAAPEPAPRAAAPQQPEPRQHEPRQHEPRQSEPAPSERSEPRFRAPWLPAPELPTPELPAPLSPQDDPSRSTAPDDPERGLVSGLLGTVHDTCGLLPVVRTVC